MVGLYKLKLTLLASLVFALFHVSLAQTSPKDYLKAHNEARAKLGIPPLTWDNKLASYAQDYANKRIEDCELLHSTMDYGENIATASWSMSAKEAVDMWIDERPFYDHASNTCKGGDCLHYTQVVWRDSVHLGCAISNCKAGGSFAICLYDPPGNVITQRPY
ncbi:PREDICTED: basic form of pathogenesis-related protein 1-like [Nelumbo nucifera]|uniref:Basic form of pathogenesis-related protein 1-like n=2 Tax=Nelumbo nucifera TaxID=4432 RepID=A0A1U8ART2_NELNU|nr:PREDICTED: basic form of pathogenesis-related protein 1-like [Nelumbo nucifera]DAD39797.1 TPA_asm: hypothetical protein HUJ06_014120 [Nelumbo nucifera]